MKRYVYAYQRITQRLMMDLSLILAGSALFARTGGVSQSRTIVFVREVFVRVGESAWLLLGTGG